MKSYELIYALMRERKLGELRLAKGLGKPSMQGQLYRLVRGQVPKPEFSTAQMLAKFFNIPVEAIYEEKVATAVAKERNLKVIPVPPAKPRNRKGPVPPSEWALRVAGALENASPEQKAVVEALLETMNPVLSKKIVDGFERVVSAGYKELISKDPHGITGNTRPSDLDDAHLLERKR